MIRTTPLSARPRRVAIAAATAGAAAIAALGMSPSAQAAFTTTKCGGESLTASGASFQSAAQSSVFKPQFEGVFCTPDPGTFPQVNYTSGGSGLGRRHMGERTAAGAENNSNGAQSRSYPERFTGTDEPLSPGGKAQIEQGTDTPGDESQIHQIPVAAGAIAPLVNFPDNCDVKSLPLASQTAPKATDGTDRALFNKAQFESIWANDSISDTWGDVFSTIAAIDTDPGTPGPQNPGNKSDAQCKAQQITRVVRFDDSGSTFTLKDALDKYNPSRDWIPTYITNPDTRNWPRATVDNGAACSPPGGPVDPTKASPVGANGPEGKPSLVTNCASGGGALVTKLKATDGSIGYADLATAVSQSLQITPTTDPNPDQYFTQMQNGNNQYTEPTQLDSGFKANNDGSNGPTGGARCTDTVFENVPPSTLGDWSNATGTNSPSGYGICTLTYALAFDDDAKAYNGSAAEERKARTVKDYLTSAVATSTQNQLQGKEYAGLPTAIRTIAQAGVNSIDWNKSGTAGGGGGGGGGGGVVTPPAGSGGGGFTPPVAKPSNLFSVPRVSISSKAGTATLSIRLPGAGKLVMEATAKIKVKVRGKTRTRTIRVAKVTRTVSKAGLVNLTLKPSSAARAVLKRAGKLKVSVKLTYTPKGGTARSTKKTITLRLKKPARKGKR